MEINPILFWNGILTVVIAPAIWVFRGMFMEIKRLDILLNKTREEYATSKELRDAHTQVKDALHRVEDKLEKEMSSGMSQLIKGKNIDVNKVQFSDPNTLDNGAKLVYVNYNNSKFIN